MHEKPSTEHQWLDVLVGEWTFEHEAVMSPGAEPTKFRGSETVRSLGGFWTIAEGTGETPGGGMHTSIMTLGFDPLQKRYVGTFLASMMSFLWVYDGQLNAAGDTLTLDTMGPDFKGGSEHVAYKDVIRIVNKDHRMLISHLQDEQGNWAAFMTANYYRKIV